MKRFIKNNLLRIAGLLAAFILAAVTFAQDYKRVGNKFIQQPTATLTVRDTLDTGYTIVDGKGNEYQIIINKSTGSCYVWKISKKSGKWYKQYIKKEISMQIAKELEIEYKGSPINSIKKK